MAFAIERHLIDVARLPLGMFAGQQDRPREETPFPLQGTALTALEAIEARQHLSHQAYIDTPRTLAHGLTQVLADVQACRWRSSRSRPAAGCSTSSTSMTRCPVRAHRLQTSRASRRCSGSTPRATSCARPRWSNKDGFAREVYPTGARVELSTGEVAGASLRQFPATELKIDPSLIIAVRSEPRIAKRVSALIDLAHNPDLTTAEGIEDGATRHLLTGMGCDFGQGFHPGRPEPAAQFLIRLATDRTSP
ncbi:MAG: EAL domain-containing protein [Rhodanobacter sp.]